MTTKKSGRPKKFDESSKVITLTLPLRTLQELEKIDVDRACAIVKAVDLAGGIQKAGASRVEIVKAMPGKAVILIEQSRRLKAIPWLQLIAISPTQHILSIPTGTPLERLELAISDIVADMKDEDGDERRMLVQLCDELARLRRERRMQKVEIILIETSEVPLSAAAPQHSVA